MTWTEDAENEQGNEENEEATEPEAVEPEPETPAEEPAAEEAAEEPAAEETSEEPVAEEPERRKLPPMSPPPRSRCRGAGRRREEARRRRPKKDVVPGADLEPIAIGEERELTAEERAAREAEEEERAAREAAAAADDEDEEIVPRTVTVPADTMIQATGKRKSAVARIIVRSGNGDFQINDRGIEEYFKSSQHQALARQPLVTAGYEGSVDVKVRVHGGGISGQAGAVRHGVARALTTLEPELRSDLKKRGMLTRDDRRKERKKAGLKKARKRPQFSKR